MRVRSLTFGASLHEREGGQAILATIAHAASAARSAIGDAGYEVQSVRLATQPLPQLLATPGAESDPVRFALGLEDSCREAGIDYCSLGPIPAVRADATVALIERVPELIAATELIFATVQVAEREGEGGVVNFNSARLVGRAMAAIASASADGFGNLRFAALANCPPHIAFFPAAYYLPDADSRPTVGVALEAADLAVDAFDRANSLEEAQTLLVAAIERVGEVIGPIMARVAGDYRLRFAGIDISLAPFPSDDKSIGRAFERLSGAPFGGPGTLAAASFITNCLRRAQVPRTGYSGLMMPVLEDTVLAARAQTFYDVDSLLLYSAVCGLGLDTVPVPGDTTELQLAGIVADMAMLAVRLNKPLTARLMPIPGKKAGDVITFDFPFFSDGRVMAVKPRGGEGLLSGVWEM